MSHHFLYHYNAYHIVIVKPSLPRFYLCNIQKISAQFAGYLPKLPSTTAKAPRRGGGGVGRCGDPWVALVPFPLPHPENDKTIAPSPLPLSYPKLYRAIFSLSRQITEHDSKGQCVPRRGGGGVEWCGDPWVALVPFPLPHPGNDKTIVQVLYLYYIQKLARKLLAISQNYRASEQPTRLRSAPKGAKIYPSELVGLIDVPVKHSRCVRSLAWQNGEQKERREKERP